MKLVRRAASFLPALLLISVGLAGGEDLKVAQEREYPYPIPALKAALENLGAYSGSRLPSLEGFIKLEGVHLSDYQRPYYEFKIELTPAAAGRTLVRVKANVSAWYATADGNNSAYRSLESNGRLEGDLLDRLDDYLKDKSADPAALARRIATVRGERTDAERHLPELEAQLRNLQTSRTEKSEAEFASVAKPRVLILSAPAEAAPVLLRAQAEDTFEVLEHRGAWLRVALEGERSGWVKRSQVQSDSPAVSNRPAVPAKALTNGFTIIRETSSDFSGDWTRLKGKRALYIWARPEGSALNDSGDKLQFAKNMFIERYRQVSHSSENSVAGIVVIFLDQKGGVAAASLDDIRLWADGSLTPQAFLKKCSLDPPSAFRSDARSD